MSLIYMRERQILDRETNTQAALHVRHAKVKSELGKTSTGALASISARQDVSLSHELAQAASGQFKLSVRIGVASGKVVASNFRAGPAFSSCWNLGGTDAIAAAKLAAAAPSNGVLVCNATKEALDISGGFAFASTDRNQHQLIGTSSVPGRGSPTTALPPLSNRQGNKQTSSPKLLSRSARVCAQPSSDSLRGPRNVRLSARASVTATQWRTPRVPRPPIRERPERRSELLLAGWSRRRVAALTPRGAPAL
jgi:hypothetical protein